MILNVMWDDGEVYIDGKFVAQCCWTADAVGAAIAAALKRSNAETEEKNKENNFE